MKRPKLSHIQVDFPAFHICPKKTKRGLIKDNESQKSIMTIKGEYP